MGPTRLVGRPGDGPPVYTYELAPGVPPISVVRLSAGSMRDVDADHQHAHDFLLLAYFDRGGGSLRLAGKDWQIETGDVYIVAPGEAVGATDDPAGLSRVQAWAVYFPADALGRHASGVFLSWRAHPLLFPFVRGATGGAQRLRVPHADRPTWSHRFEELDRELRERRDGHREAALALLALLLIAVGRLAVDVVGDLRLSDEPLLADVFAFIEERHHEPVSLRDVAVAVNLTPGHLTTVVKRRTGRTVQEWITERRLAEARRLLSQTDLPVDQVGRRAGYGDAGHFTRSFKRMHGVTPVQWRRASRP